MNFFSSLGSAFNFIISRPLGYILYWCYYLVRNYGLAIVLFTCVTRILLWPLAVKQQKSQAEMMRFQPKIAELQKKYGNNKEKLQEEQMKLYQEEGYNPMGGCLPMLIQLPILWGLFNVIYKPYTYILGYSSDIITKLVTALKEPLLIMGKAAGNAFGSANPSIASMTANQKIEIFLANAIQGNPEKVANIIPHTAFKLDFSFMGLDLTRIPDFKSVYIIFPILCYVTQFISTWMSMKLNQMNQQQGAAATAAMNKSMIVLMPLMTVFFAFQVPSGITLYWITMNLFMMLQVVLLNKFYNPQKLMAKAETEADAKRAKRLEKLKKYEQLTGQKMTHRDSQTETESAPEHPVKTSGGKSSKGKQKNTQNNGSYQPKKVNPNGKKTKKQLMEENRRRLSAAREHERETEQGSGKTKEKEEK